MKNLRGSVLTVMVAILVGGTGELLVGQQLSPGTPGGFSATGLPQSAPGFPGTAGPQGPLAAPAPTTIGPGPGALPQRQNQTPIPVAPFAALPVAQAAYPIPAQMMAAPDQMAPGYPMQAAPGMMPMSGVYPASYGPPQPMPTGPMMPMQAGYEAAYGQGHGGGCANCGGQGCAACAGGGGGRGPRGGGLDQIVDRLLPYGEGGPCAPRWYDIVFEGMYLKREDAGRSINFSSDGIVVGSITPQDVLLSTDDLSFNDELGFRLTGSMQLFAGANLEFTYFGLFNWATHAVNRDPTFQDDIYSVISNFGTTPFNGFDQTDRARQHSLSYSSEINNFELSVRKRFTAPNCRIQYSWLAGVRYFYLLEDFNHFTLGGDSDPVAPGLQSRGSMNYDVRARNSLTGFQLGGDLWATLIPGVRFGADLKAGVYGNYANQGTNIMSLDSVGAATTFAESVNSNDISMIAEANLMFLWRLGPHWTIKSGYNLLFLEGVALAPENFNATPPNILTTGGGFTFPTRTSTLNDDGNVFYHGAFLGAEWMW